MPEREPLPIQYINKFIDKKARETSKLAAKTPNPESDPIIDEAIFYDSLANEPTPWYGADNDSPEDSASDSQ